MKKIIALLLLLHSFDSFSQSLENQEDNTIYNTAGINVKPEFPGGLDKLKSLVKENYLKAGFQPEKKEKALATFVIEKDGSLSDVKILRGVDATKADALIQILKSLPNWNPGKIKGKVVRVLYSLPLVFSK